MSTLETQAPAAKKIFLSLLRADLVVQWRNRRASLMSIVVPILILISWKSVVDKLGGSFALSSCITIGLIATGLMGYANTLARDREKGVFHRLRVTPASTFQIMISRIVVQLIQMGVMTIMVFVAGYLIDDIVLSAGAYFLALIAALLCGAVFLSLALVIVGLITSAEIVNAVTRFTYIALVFIGAIGELGVLGDVLQKVILWSPYGSVKTVLLGAMQISASGATWASLALSILYIAVFCILGIKWFKWKSQ
jgi:ABC-2 type transport system permease protein